MPDVPRVRVSVVGAGYTAREHIRAFSDVDGVDVVGVYSRTKERAVRLAAEMGIATVAESIPELFDTTSAHLVVITVPELAMRPTVESCLQYGATLLIEKPPGYCLEDARMLRDAVVSGAGRVFVGLNRRFLSATTSVRSALDQADLGPRFIKVQDQQSPVAARAAGQPEAVVANWMFANSIHTIDYVHVFGLGVVDEVRPYLPWRPESPGIVLAEIRFSSGDIAVYEGIWNAPGPWAVTVTVPGRRWEIRPLERAAQQVAGSAPVELPVDPWDVAFKPGFRAQAQAVIDAVRGLPSDAVTLADAFATMELIDRIFLDPA